MVGEMGAVEASCHNCVDYTIRIAGDVAGKNPQHGHISFPKPLLARRV